MKINTEARSHGVTERKKYDAGFKMQDARCKILLSDILYLESSFLCVSVFFLIL
jgi:hypothetical protein